MADDRFNFFIQKVIATKSIEEFIVWCFNRKIVVFTRHHLNIFSKMVTYATESKK